MVMQTHAHFPADAALYFLFHVGCVKEALYQWRFKTRRGGGTWGGEVGRCVVVVHRLLSPSGRRGQYYICYLGLVRRHANPKTIGPLTPPASPTHLLPPK